MAWKDGLAGDIVSVATRGRWEVLCEGGSYDNGDRIGVDSVDGVGRKVNSEANQPFAFCIQDIVLATTSLLKCVLHTQETY